jgi:uncharacterized protein DUF669
LTPALEPAQEAGRLGSSIRESAVGREPLGAIAVYLVRRTPRSPGRAEEMSMRYDFNLLADRPAFSSVPEGTYACRVIEVRERTARDGSPRWNLRLEVTTGEYAGRTAGWDSITWSDRGVHRVQQVLCALGIDARGELELDASELIGRQAVVQFELEEREDPGTGKRQLYLRVPYAGFQPLDSAAGLDERSSGRDNGSVGIDGEGGGGGSSADGPSLEGAAAAAF